MGGTTAPGTRGRCVRWRGSVGAGWLVGAVALAVVGCDSSTGGEPAGGGFGGQGARAADAGSMAGLTAAAGATLTSGGGYGGATEADAGCRRDVSLTAVTVGAPPPFDLVIVADNSDSLSWSRNDLSSGLRDLLTDVKGRSVRVFMLTPTQYEASSAAAQIPLSGESVVDWKDAATAMPYQNAMTTFTQTCTDAASMPMSCPSSTGKVPYRSHGTWQFEMPDPIAVITPTMTDTEFAAQQKAVSDAILGLGGGGSATEQPLCTLARYIGQSRAMLPKNVVFLLISDEDDTSTPKQCVASFDSSLLSMTFQSAGDTCTTGCDASRYTMNADTSWQVLLLDCAAFDDLGNRIAGTEKQNRLNERGPPTCSGFAEGPCTDAESQRGSPFCPTGLRLVGCQRKCESGVADCTLDLPFGTSDACTQAFTKDGTSYTNIADYCTKTNPSSVYSWERCQSRGIKFQSTTQLSGSYLPQPLMPGTTTAEIGGYFRSRADSTFGPDQYAVEAIVLDPAFSCKLESGQSYAKNLADFVRDRQKLFPLCEPYSKALEGVSTFAGNLVQTSFRVPLKADEHLTSVHLVGADNSDRALPATQYRYDAATQQLTIDRTALGTAAATLRVEITSDCRPIIR